MTSTIRLLTLVALIGALCLACSRPEPVRTDPPKAATGAEKAPAKAPTKAATNAPVEAKAPAPAPKAPLFNGLSSDEQKALKKTYAKQAAETITLENAEKEAAALEKLVEDELAAD